ncbi:hypothetical protein CRUP_010142, partial [Coryphaenoides rupestris]
MNRGSLRHPFETSSRSRGAESLSAPQNDISGAIRAPPPRAHSAARAAHGGDEGPLVVARVVALGALEILSPVEPPTDVVLHAAQQPVSVVAAHGVEAAAHHRHAHGAPALVHGRGRVPAPRGQVQAPHAVVEVHAVVAAHVVDAAVQHDDPVERARRLLPVRRHGHPSIGARVPPQASSTVCGRRGRVVDSGSVRGEGVQDLERLGDHGPAALDALHQGVALHVALHAAEPPVSVVAARGVEAAAHHRHAHVAPALVHGRGRVPAPRGQVQAPHAVVEVHAVEAAHVVDAAVQHDDPVRSARGSYDSIPLVAVRWLQH